METFIKNSRHLLSLLLMFPYALLAQNHESPTQYLVNQTTINPAYTLLDKNGVLNGSIRRQWIGVEGAPVTSLFDIAIPIESIDGKTGAFINSDKLAVEQLTGINGFFAKQVQLSANTYLGVSLNAGISKYSARYSSLDPTDTQFKDDVIQTQPNIGFGVIYYSERLMIGASLPQLKITSLGHASSNVASRAGAKSYFSGAYLIDIAEGLMFKPAFLAIYRKAETNAHFSGTVYAARTIGLGLNFGTDNQKAGIITVLLPVARIGYSYQFGNGAASGGLGNAVHGVSLSYRFGKHLDQSRYF